MRLKKKDILLKELVKVWLVLSEDIIRRKMANKNKETKRTLETDDKKWQNNE